jgi:hypothetical protein
MSGGLNLASDAALPSSFSSFRRGNQAHSPKFLRPDRQTNFGGRPPWEWPKPEHDRHTISVDRVGETPEEGPYRFSVCLGDVVRVWMGDDQFHLGRVVEISHEHSVVSVQLASRKHGTWFCTERLYPARQDQLRDLEPEKDPPFTAPMTGKQIQSLMRQHHVTIAELSKRMQIIQKRIREVREQGLTDANTVRDWVQGITGADPGPIAGGVRPVARFFPGRPAGG